MDKGFDGAKLQEKSSRSALLVFRTSCSKIFLCRVKIICMWYEMFVGSRPQKILGLMGRDTKILEVVWKMKGKSWLLTGRAAKGVDVGSH